MNYGEGNIWEQAQEKLKQTLDEYSYKNWFSHTRFESCQDRRLIVGVPSQFFADWLRDHYQDTVESCVRELMPELQEVCFLATTETKKSDLDESARPAASPNQPGLAFRARPLPAGPRRLEGFNPRYIFDRFVVGNGNRFAHAAAKAVAQSPARAYNPLFLYGMTGLGKTHLMQAIGHEIADRQPGAQVVFISSEHFTNQLIESIARKATPRFRAKYRRVDVLLIDDIHFIANKEATQEEFFHTFNALFDNHKQIVISSDRQPKEIKATEDRLVSRFEWGLVTDIQPPDLETRVAILQSRAAEQNLVIPPEVLTYIATYITSNIRELEGALVTVLACSKLMGQKITLPLAEEVLRDLIGREKTKAITIEGVQRIVSEEFDVRISDLRGRSRQRQVAFPRQIAMYLCKTLIPNLSLSEVGEAFGGKDHTTVLYACQKIEKDSRNNSEVQQLLTRLEKKLRS